MSGKRRKHNRRRNRRKNKHNQQTQHKTFDVGAFICIRKQREGVGIVNKKNKNSYLIAFKNGKWGWYRCTKINVITEQEYLQASAQFEIDKNLPSPSPTPSFSYTASPAPSPPDHIKDKQLQYDEEIKFTEPIAVAPDVDVSSSQAAFQIKIDDISATVPDEANIKDTTDDTDIDDTKSEPEDVTHIDDTSATANIDTTPVDQPDIDACDTKTDEDVVAKPVTNIKDDRDTSDGKRVEAKAKKVIQKVHISKFEKKMKKYGGNYKVKDERERSFLIMCDENKRIDYNALYEYIEHFGAVKPSKNKVQLFLDYMKPNVNGFVTFSRFVRAIDEDGDIIAGYKRFKKCGNARATK
eukprot:182308_1